MCLPPQIGLSIMACFILNELWFSMYGQYESMVHMVKYGVYMYELWQGMILIRDWVKVP